MASEKGLDAILKVDRSVPDSVKAYNKEIKELTESLAKLQTELKGIDANNFAGQKGLQGRIRTTKQSLANLSGNQSANQTYKEITKQQQDKVIDGLVNHALRNGRGSSLGRVVPKGEKITDYPPEFRKMIQTAQSMLQSPEFVSRRLGTPNADRANLISKNATKHMGVLENQIKKHAELADKIVYNQKAQLRSDTEFAKHKGQLRSQELRAERKRIKDTNTAHTQAIIEDRKRTRQRQAQVEKQIQAQNKVANRPTMQQQAANSRAMSRERLFGDGGGHLFRTQGALLGNYAVMGAGIGGVQATLAFTIELDKAFKQLQSIVRLTDTEMQVLEKTLISVSEKTKFTAVEVAESSIVLGQAGFSKDQIEKAIEPITLFATAVGTDLKQAVELSTSVMGVFNMNASEMANNANIMTTAINKSKLTMDKLSLGLQYSGNLAAQAGIEFKEVVALLGAMANSGIRAGSMLGTGFRQVLIALQSPSDKLKTRLRELGLSLSDIDVRANGMVNVLKTLHKAGFTSSDAMKVLQTRAASAFSAMSNNLDVADKLSQAMGATDSAAEANAIQMTALANQWARLKSIALSLGAESLDPLKNTFTHLITSTATILENIKGWGSALQVGGALLSGAVLYKGMKWLGGLLISVAGLKGGGGLAGASSVGGYNAGGGRANPYRGAGGLASRSGKALMRGLPVIGTAAAIYGLGTDIFGNGNSELDNLADKQKASANQSYGDFDSTRTNIKRVEDALTKIYSRSSMGEAELMSYIEGVESGFKDLYFTLSDVEKGSAHAIEELRKFRDELVSNALNENKIAVGEKVILKGTQEEQLSKLLSKSFQTTTGDIHSAGSGLYSSPLSSAQTTTLSEDVSGIRASAETLRKLGTPTDEKSTKALERELLTLIGVTSEKISSKKYQAKGAKDSEDYRALVEVVDHLNDIRKANLNLLETITGISSTKAEGKLEGDSAELFKQFEKRTTDLQAKFLETGKHPIYNKSDHFLEKSQLAKKQDAELQVEIKALLDELIQVGKDKGYGIGAVDDAGSQLRNLTASSNTRRVDAASLAEPELAAIYANDKRVASKDLAKIKAGISRTTSREALIAYRDKAILAIKEINEAVFNKNVIGLDEAKATDSQAYTQAKKAQKDSNFNDIEKIKTEYANNLGRLTGYDVAKKLYGSGTYDAVEVGKVDDRYLTKAFSDGASGEMAKIATRYEKDKVKGETPAREMNRLKIKSAESLGRYGDVGLTESARDRSFTAAILQLKQVLKALNDTLRADKDALTNKIKGLETLKSKEANLATDANGDLRFSSEAKKRIKKYDEDIEKARTKITELETKILKNTGDSEEQIRELNAGRPMLDYSRSNFYTERHRQVRASYDGTQYTTDAGNTEDFNGVQTGIFGQIYEQTNAQFKGFDGMTETILELQGVVDGLGEHVSSAMMEFVTGAESGKDALKGMLHGIMEDLAQAASRMLSNQMIMLLLQSIGGSMTGAGLPAGGQAASTSDINGALTGGLFNGGSVFGGSFSGGGLINRGKTQRDSTLIHAAKGEFVVRKEAVDSIGLESMHQLNALTKSSAKAKLSASGAARATDVVVPKTETNVYLLDKTSAPPSMSPNDVVAVINDDIVRSGRTKTLIKQVMTGSV